MIYLGVKSDYSLLQSMIKIKDLIKYLVDHNISACGLIDDNLNGSIEFYNACIKNNIKPIIGLEVKVNELSIYLYAKNYEGYKRLLKINTLKQERTLVVSDFNDENIIVVVPFGSKELYSEISNNEVYLSYRNDIEKSNALLITRKVLYLNNVRSFKKEDTKYLSYLSCIGSNSVVVDALDNLDYFNELSDDSTLEFSKLIDIEISENKVYIPKYPVDDSYSFLVALCKKGLYKRLNDDVNDEYIERLKRELDVIKTMGFIDYFLIVYDYVKFAKQNDILVGPGRGSAAGSLVSYALGITEVDPIKYDLLFERFLNPERISMPDIDIDFEYTKRDLVIDYVRDKYGKNCVAPIITYGTLASKQAIRDVGRAMGVELSMIDQLTKLIDVRDSLIVNAKNPKIVELVKKEEVLKKVYKVAVKLEGLKRHISTHAAGVVVSSIELDEIIPIYYNGDTLVTGLTMEYLEELGLLKMDFLALKNLTIIKNVVDLINLDSDDKLNINKIDLEDKDVINLFKKVDTEGIFQFESHGMKNFLKKLQIDSFSDIVAALALYRPGPMENIDIFIKRKNGQEKIEYLDQVLEPILKDTYGIMIYQEQIMQVLVTMGNYSYAEADNIRRAMSKKKKSVMESERVKFVESSIKGGYSKETAEAVYDLVVKFANYGFNKAHSVSYALIGYQMAYLKVKYPEYFYTNLLNISALSEVKTRDYLSEIKRLNLKLVSPNINESKNDYVIKNKELVMPLILIKGLGSTHINSLLKERDSNGEYSGYLNFVVRASKVGVTNHPMELLIRSGALDELGFNRRTMLNNLETALDYASLCMELDEDLVLKPIIKTYEEDIDYLKEELELFGFYISNHPASKYLDVVKVNGINEKFDKNVVMVVLINKVKVIKTKNDLEMAFLNGSDESGNCEFVIFPKQNELIKRIVSGKLVKVYGKVTRREYNYQVVVSNIEEVGEVNG